MQHAAPNEGPDHARRNVISKGNRRCPRRIDRQGLGRQQRAGYKCGNNELGRDRHRWVHADRPGAAYLGIDDTLVASVCMRQLLLRVGCLFNTEMRKRVKRRRLLDAKKAQRRQQGDNGKTRAAKRMHGRVHERLNIQEFRSAIGKSRARACRRNLFPASKNNKNTSTGAPGRPKRPETPRQCWAFTFSAERAAVRRNTARAA